MLFIFDWDGTLCDSTQKIAHSMVAAASSLNLPELTAEQVFNIIGLGLPEAIAVLFPGITAKDAERLRQAYSKEFLESDQVPSALFDGVQHTLEQLKSQGAKIAVATGKSRRGLNRILSAIEWDEYFHGSRCADETASKPNPLMLHELLEELDYRAEDAVLIGDTEYDMAMARNAAMPRIAVSYGAHHVDRLRPYEPALCVDHISGVLRYLTGKAQAV